MSLNTKEEIQEKFFNAAPFADSKDELEHNTKMLMYRFLSEIERLAEEKNLNRKELASLIGISASYITQLFRGTKILNLETIAKFQKVFNVTFKVEAIYDSKSLSNVQEEEESKSLRPGQGRQQEFETRARGRKARV